MSKTRDRRMKINEHSFFREFQMRCDGGAMIHGVVSLHGAVHIYPPHTLSILIEMQFSRENCQRRPKEHQV